ENSALNPAPRILHELGHVASTLSNRGQSRTMSYGQYCWPDGNGFCGWTATTAEWGEAQFEEAIATFFGLGGLYTQDAISPRYCFTEGACSSGHLSVERTSCEDFGDGPVNRYPITALRYLWDAYDTRNDGESNAMP